MTIQKKKKCCGITHQFYSGRQKQPALLLCANCGHSLLKETDVAEMFRCPNQWILCVEFRPSAPGTAGGKYPRSIHQYAASMLEKERKKISSKKAMRSYKDERLIPGYNQKQRADS